MMGSEAEAQPSSPQKGFSRSEWSLILVLVAVQFTHMVDFVIMMPLGERFMNELFLAKPIFGIQFSSEHQFGLVVSAYAWAAGLASLAASLVMDRFDRRTVLLVMYSGFTVSTYLCGVAWNFESMLAARFLAGSFGGVAAVALNAIIGDVFPPERRGRATGAVMSAFAVASVAGLPVGLALADWFGRAAPFAVLAVVSAMVWVIAWFKLPAIRGHMTAVRKSKLEEFMAVVKEPNHLKAFVFSFFLVLGTFTVASFIAPYLRRINGWKEGDLAVIYFFAGISTLVGMNVVGRLADRFPRRPLYQILAGLALVTAVVVTNLPPGPLWVATVVLTLFMVFAAGRMVPAQTILLGAAAPRVRGAFLSLNTAVQHLATGAAASIAGLLVGEDFSGFPLVGVVAAITAAISIVLIVFIRHAPTDRAVSAVVETVHDSPVIVAEPKPTAA